MTSEGHGGGPVYDGPSVRPGALVPSTRANALAAGDRASSPVLPLVLGAKLARLRRIVVRCVGPLLRIRAGWTVPYSRMWRVSNSASVRWRALRRRRRPTTRSSPLRSRWLAICGSATVSCTRRRSRMTTTPATRSIAVMCANSRSSAASSLWRARRGSKLWSTARTLMTERISARVSGPQRARRPGAARRGRADEGRRSRPCARVRSSERREARGAVSVQPNSVWPEGHA